MIRAAGIIYKCKDSYLLLKRAKDNFWGVAGGKIDGNETPEQAASRESLEEINFFPNNPLIKVDFSSDGNVEFTTFVCETAQFKPVLNAEHTEYVWARLEDLPLSVHPGLASTLQKIGVSVTMDSARVVDDNGWFEIKNNPLSKVGIYQYSGAQIGADPSKIYNVYRPEEELSNYETIESFKLIPWINDHLMLGDSEAGLTPAEKKGIEGILGQEVYYDNGILYGNIKVLSENLANLIESGKNQLSAGYRCVYEMVSGVWNNMPYDAVQRNIRGNHLALVQEGRMGREVAVLDHAKYTFDSIEITKEFKKMPDEIEKKEETAEMTLSEAVKLIKEIAPQVKALQDALANKTDSKEDGGLEDTTTDGLDPTVKGLDSESSEEKDADKKKDGMDAALLRTEIETLKKNGVKTMLTEISARDALAKKLSNHVGTFDSAEMTLAEVAAYGVKKLNIKCPEGSEKIALDGFLHNRKAETSAFALDSAQKTSGALDAFINNNK